jgi:N6-adenosine-specific RNA methylase IME4
MTTPYSIIYADPPWKYRDSCNAGLRGACHKYSVMSIEELCLLRGFIDDVAARDCFLAMWWVPPMPVEALTVVSAWGFQLKTMKGFTWRKLTRGGLEHFGMGHWTRANSEDCLFAVRGHPKPVSHSVRQIINAQVREHSRKPDEARDRLVQLLGDVPRIELFARQAMPGWDVWGNEAPATNVDRHLDAL